MIRRTRTRSRPVAQPAPPLIAQMGAAEDILKDVMRSGYSTIQHTRAGHHLHVSDLLSKCIRKRVLCHRFGIRMPSRRLTMSDMLTFAQGDAIHDLIKNQAREAAPTMVYGKWSCKCEYLRIDEPCVYSEIEQETCPYCRTQVDTYHEVSMFDEELWIVGNPDLLLWLPDYQAFHITELKSIAHEQWKELVRPKPEHVLQVVFYWYLMNKLGYPLTDKVTIFYASKGWMFGDPTKEFVIEPQHEIHRLEDMIEDARAYKVAIESGEGLPLRSYCPNIKSKDAQACEVAIQCFEV